MSPHGTRPAHTPRSATPAARKIMPSQVKDIPMLAERRPGSPALGGSVLVSTAVPPALSVTTAAVTGTARRRPTAKEAAKNTMAIAKVIIEA